MGEVIVEEKVKPTDVVISFDTTGSMYPCLTQVRRKVEDLVTTLFNEVPDLRIAIIAHGDYYDARSTYITKHLPLSDTENSISSFVHNVEPTGGGDSDECYELVLKEAKEKMKWNPEARKIIIMIGDAEPHKTGYRFDGKTYNIDWKTEAKELALEGISIYAVQCLNRRSSNYFYEGLAQLTNGYKLDLEQFNQIPEMILAILYQQHSNEKLQNYEQELTKQGRMSRSTAKMFDTLNKRKATTFKVSEDLNAVEAGKFQILDVDKDMKITDFVNEQGLIFQKGRGFYEFTKSEIVQAGKEVVLQDKLTGDLFEGDYARVLIGLPKGEKSEGRLKPVSLDKYNVFIQSTSYTRKLMGGTKFLYQVDKSR